jgi:2-C-methyl-D-erythritol 4-phosphate cytidylyltransferase/2-C-methyl-D-erythritol 2,4-cyclodiphosphate synthase
MSHSHAPTEGLVFAGHASYASATRQYGRDQGMTATGEIAAVVVAAGRGERAGASAEGPKQYRMIGGVPVIRRTLEALAAGGLVGRIVVAIHPDDSDLFGMAVGDMDPAVIVVPGGMTRQASTLLALEALADDPPAYVMIHDGVRPFVDPGLLARIAEALTPQSGVLPALPVTDTLKRSATGMVETTVSREKLFAAQTPQAFPFGPILDAHRRAAGEGKSHFTDDCAIAEWAGLPMTIVPGSPDNVKLTYAGDIAMADERLSGSWPDVRTGNGYDVHAFGPGEAVTLCGVRIPYGRALSGHSDADVGLHALTDALLATCGAGDIGTHFPPSQPQWKGAASRIFVEHAAALVREKGGRIANADVTLIAEAPRVGPHRAAMVEAMAAMLGIEAGRVSVKATTNERLGFVGREEGIAAIATATVVYPGRLSPAKETT